ncbi:hypothetical protein [Actinomadura alba]|uniref:Uncharacterized protein n=1 Tax=Actinomadura alba TaxID=406431 RepID=A0ABR7LVE3_9ACTN|nr:hypothetical protein [Actinomadura alba]MBC6468731.1 hypothetical protein [Actinomadura alba]
MGSSAWTAFSPYQDGISAALEHARQQAFEDQDYYWPYGKNGIPEHPRPSSLDSFWQPNTTEEFGAHCVIDAEVALAPGEEPDFGTLSPPSIEDAIEVFGIDQPTRADFERAENDVWDLINEESCGCYLVLYKDGQPHEIVFWGISGD